jgi:hypothetical protein
MNYLDKRGQGVLQHAAKVAGLRDWSWDMAKTIPSVSYGFPQGSPGKALNLALMGEKGREKLRRRDSIYYKLTFPGALVASILAYKYTRKRVPSAKWKPFLAASGASSLVGAVGSNLATYQSRKDLPFPKLAEKVANIKRQLVKYDPLYAAEQAATLGGGQKAKGFFEGLFGKGNLTPAGSEVAHGVGGAALGGGVGYASGSAIDASPEERRRMALLGALSFGGAGYAAKRGLNRFRKEVRLEAGAPMPWEMTRGFKASVKADPGKQFTGMSVPTLAQAEEAVAIGKIPARQKETFSARDLHAHYKKMHPSDVQIIRREKLHLDIGGIAPDRAVHGYTAKDTAAVTAFSASLSNLRKGVLGGETLLVDPRNMSQAERLVSELRTNNPDATARQLRAMLHPDRHARNPNQELYAQAYKIVRETRSGLGASSYEDAAHDMGAEIARKVHKRMRGLF